MEVMYIKYNKIYIIIYNLQRLQQKKILELEKSLGKEKVSFTYSLLKHQPLG